MLKSGGLAVKVLKNLLVKFDYIWILPSKTSLDFETFQFKNSPYCKTGRSQMQPNWDLGCANTLLLTADKFFVCVDIIIILMGLICTGVDCRLCIMSLACLICHSSDRSHSFRSYSISSSENDSRCSTIVSCLSRKVSVPPPETANSTTTSKVTPQPIMLNSQGITGAPRLVRSCAVRRDLVRDWNFDEVLVEG